MTNNFKTVYILTKAAWNEDIDSPRDDIIQHALCIPYNAVKSGLITQDEYNTLLHKVADWPHNGHPDYYNCIA